MQSPAFIPQHGLTLEGIMHLFASEMFDFAVLVPLYTSRLLCLDMCLDNFN